MERKPISIAAKKRDSTIYLVEYTISDNAKESAYEKVKRLILKDTKSYLEKSPPCTAASRETMNCRVIPTALLTKRLYYRSTQTKTGFATPHFS